MDEEELLRLVRSESEAALGYDTDDELISDREKALKYYKGEVPDLPSLPNRSTAVSSDVRDGIDTLLPDLIEMFAGGDDVLAFVPVGAEDEKAAKQETEYVKHVMFNENQGWLTLYSMFKDALQVKTGVVKFWAEECPPEVETVTGQSAVALQMATEKGGEIVEAVPVGEISEEQPEQLYDARIQKPTYRRVRIEAVPPEDFACARDTVRLADTTYCKMRSRQRAQDLLPQGFDQADVDDLPGHSSAGDDSVSQARDTVAEGDAPSPGEGPLRTVEIVEHVLRIADKDGVKIYSIVTDGDCTKVLKRNGEAREELPQVPFASVTPYLVAHRWVGESVADRLVEIQKISTALTRIALDSAYFSLNQRQEVAEDSANENTIPDLLNNIPGAPVRVKRSGTVTPIQAGALNYDIFGALEFMQTKAEQRTGIVRAAQGLTPDTLHDTAKGALALLTAAQKRVRLIGRIFAETGLKDLYLGVHRLLREHGGQGKAIQLSNEWVELDPTSWGIRSDMQIEVGEGASGKEAELRTLQEEMLVMEKVIALQGGPTGPIVTFKEVYNLAIRVFERLGNKAPEKYLKDPEQEMAQPQQPPPPDPKLVEVEKKAELAEKQALGDYDLKTKAADADSQLKVRKAELDAETQRHLNALEVEAKERQAAAELALKERVLVAERDLKERMFQQQLVLDREQNAQRAMLDRENNFDRNEVTRESNFHKNQMSADIGSVEVGGEPG